jgi:hypothetical protein
MYLTKSHRVRRIDPGGLDTFVAEVDARDVSYTDLLLVPHKLAGHEELVNRLQQASE